MTALGADVSDSRKTRVSGPRVACACLPNSTHETNERKLNGHHVTIDWTLEYYTGYCSIPNIIIKTQDKVRGICCYDLTERPWTVACVLAQGDAVYVHQANKTTYKWLALAHLLWSGKHWEICLPIRIGKPINRMRIARDVSISVLAKKRIHSKTLMY